MESPSLEIFQSRLDAVLCSLLWVTLLGQGVGLGDPQRSLPTPAMVGFCDSVRVPALVVAVGSPGMARTFIRLKTESLITERVPETLEREKPLEKDIVIQTFIFFLQTRIFLFETLL